MVSSDLEPNKRLPDNRFTGTVSNNVWEPKSSLMSALFIPPFILHEIDDDDYNDSPCRLFRKDHATRSMWGGMTRGTERKRDGERCVEECCDRLTGCPAVQTHTHTRRAGCLF